MSVPGCRTRLPGPLLMFPTFDYAAQLVVKAKSPGAHATAQHGPWWETPYWSDVCAVVPSAACAVMVPDTLVPPGCGGIVASQRPPPAGEKPIDPSPDGLCTFSTTLVALPPLTRTTTTTG